MKHLSRTRLFLLEMLVNLFVFCVGAAICLMALSHAYSLSANSRVSTQAQRVVQNAAMAFRATDGELSQMPSLLSGRMQDDVLHIWYSQDWQPVAEADGIYCLTISVKPLENHVRQANITVSPVQGGQPVAELSVCEYTGPALKEADG
ncbi:MAG: hypothetical protein Q3Y08_01700 [Butyricicoccus sp.]|nr:hypothetical protein [Butyricicoccus sp.]